MKRISVTTQLIKTLSPKFIFIKIIIHITFLRPSDVQDFDFYFVGFDFIFYS